MKNLLNSAVVLSFLFLVGLGCEGSFTTANISELKFGKNDKADPTVATFETNEDIYAVAVVSNTSGKHKLTWRVTYDDVKGKAPGEEVGTNSSDFEGASRLWQTFSSPLPGRYKVEATLFDDKGKVIDTKSGTVMVE